MSTCAKCKCTVFLWGKNVFRDAYKGKGNEKNNFIFGVLVDGVKQNDGCHQETFTRENKKEALGTFFSQKKFRQSL